MPGILCEHCTAVCCRYIALPIDTPETKSDFDDVRWYLLHDGVSAFIEDGDWYLNIATSCRHLQPDFRCGIYETRPRICREYSTDNCDYHSGDYGWEEHFTCPEHIDAYRRMLAKQKRRKIADRKAKTNARKGGRMARTKVRLRNRLLAERAARKERREPRILVDRDIRGVPLPILNLAR